jgi:regulator of RNase E activity RraA
MDARKLSHGDLLRLKRLNTPTLYNGWEQITRHDRTRGCFNLEPVHDFMPWMGPMVGYAVTVVIEPGNGRHPQDMPDAWSDYRSYVAGVSGPKVVVVQDLDKPVVGSFWGEVNANAHVALGCVGTVTDGSVRDLDEMANAGFKAVARQTTVGHAYAWPVKWNCEVEVFGCPVRPGALIHADKHGFLVIPEDDQERLYEAAVFMDANECNTVIAAARSASGKSNREILSSLNDASQAFRKAVEEKFRRRGEW